MTHELLQTAYKINREIEELEAQHQLVESMLSNDNLWISDHNNGEVLLSREARLDILNTVLNGIDTRKEELEDRLRML